MLMFLGLMFLFAADGLLTRAAVAAPGSGRGGVESKFQSWSKTELWRKARKHGISRRVFNRAMGALTLNWKLPDLRPPGSPARAPHKYDQSEFSSPERYFNEKNINTLVAMSRKRLARWRDDLKRIERRYGVPARIVVAIWGR